MNTSLSKRALLLLLSSLFLAVAPVSPADTIWDNGAPDQGSGYFSDIDSPGSPRVGDNFTLATSATATQVQWWGFYVGANTPTTPDNFTISFYNITAGIPSTVPLFSYLVGNAVGRADSGLNSGPSDIYSYTALIPSSSFLPGSYLLSIVNNTAADADDNWAWAASDSSNGGMSWFRNSDAQLWSPTTGHELAFNITGTVPESGTTALVFAFSLAAIFFVQRRLGAFNRELRGSR